MYQGHAVNEGYSDASDLETMSTWFSISSAINIKDKI